MSTIGSLKELARKGLSAVEISDELGVSRQNVYQIFKRRLPKTYAKWKELRKTIKQQEATAKKLVGRSRQDPQNAIRVRLAKAADRIALEEKKRKARDAVVAERLEAAIKVRSLEVAAKVRRQEDKAALQRKEAAAKKAERVALYGAPLLGKDATQFEKVTKKIYLRKRRNCLQSSKKKWEFTILWEDIVFPKRCPVLGIPLEYPVDGKHSLRGGLGLNEAAPSFDRIDPLKGYVKGNVIVVSWRANRIKNDGTPKEHRQIADYYEGLNTPAPRKATKRPKSRC